VKDWKPINGFSNYEVSDDGNVRNKTTKKILKPGRNPKGYSLVTLYENRKSETKKVHRLVAEAFCNKEPGDREVNHIDGNKRNNRASNLEWCTGSVNIKHAYDTGLKKPPRTVRVKVVETGKIYDSMSDCARDIHGDVRGITDCKHGRQSSHRGYHFEWI